MAATLQVCPVFLVVLLIISAGLIYIFKKDWAWSIAEWMLRTVKPQRTPEWERWSTMNGLILLVSGVIILIFLITWLFS